MTYDTDFILCECPLDELKRLTLELERDYSISVSKEPSICLTMVRAEDSLEKQEFYLGEALTTECEVSVDGEPGYGLCLGEEPERGYCLAVLDAFLFGGISDQRVDEFVNRQRVEVERKDREAFARTLRTRVDFKLMEEE